MHALLHALDMRSQTLILVSCDACITSKLVNIWTQVLGCHMHPSSPGPPACACCIGIVCAYLHMLSHAMTNATQLCHGLTLLLDIFKSA